MLHNVKQMATSTTSTSVSAFVEYTLKLWAYCDPLYKVTSSQMCASDLGVDSEAVHLS